MVSKLHDLATNNRTQPCNCKQENFQGTSKEIELSISEFSASQVSLKSNQQIFLGMSWYSSGKSVRLITMIRFGVSSSNHVVIRW